MDTKGRLGEGVSENGPHNYLDLMFKAFEFCLPTTAAKVRADVRPDFNWNGRVMGYR
jgi:hypothetical protein